MFMITCPKLHVRFKVCGSVTVCNMLSRLPCIQVPRVVGFSAEITWSCFGCWRVKESKMSADLILLSAEGISVSGT